MNTAFRLHTMKLHEVMDDTEWEYKIIKVPGGWMYTELVTNSSVFVPYNDQFHPSKETSQLLKEAKP